MDNIAMASCDEQCKDCSWAWHHQTPEVIRAVRKQRDIWDWCKQFMKRKENCERFKNAKLEKGVEKRNKAK